MGKLSGEFREPNRKDKVTRFPSASYARQLRLLVNTLGSHLKLRSLYFRKAHFFNQSECVTSGRYYNIIESTI